MGIYEIAPELNLKNIIAELREFTQAVSEFACDLERIEAKYAEPKESEEQTEYHGTEDMDGLYYCPICKQTTTVVKDGKCPKCGATMDELSTREQTEDAISRQAALDAFGLSEKTRKYGGDHSGYDTMMLYEIQQTLEDLPSVTPKQKTGHWIKDDITERSKSAYKHKCDRCGAYHRAMYDYCPSCGAKMIEPQESEEQL